MSETNKVKETANKVSSTIEAIQNSLGRAFQTGELTHLVTPSLEEVVTEEHHWKDLSFIFEIAEKYREEGIELNAHDANFDALHLAAALMRLSSVVGYSKGVAHQAESNRKFQNSQAVIMAKHLAESEHGLKLSEAGAENIARSSSREAIEQAGVANITSEGLSNCYFASMTFIRVLEGVAQRMHYEKKLSNQ